MPFDDWMTRRSGCDTESAVALAREAWDAAQAEERVEFYPHANWASLSGLFGPARLRKIADQIEQGYGPGLH